MANTQLVAYMNNGRWLIKCPVDGTPLRANEAGMVCPRCHPGMMARALKPIPGGLFRPVPDVELIEQARQEAFDADEVYLPIYPDDRAEIERILRLRPNPANMNWNPGETVADLIQQNIVHGIPVE